jgi:hypothetical protein
VRGGVAALRLVFARVRHTLAGADVAAVGAVIERAEKAARDDDKRAAGAAAGELAGKVAGLAPAHR